MDDQGRSDPEEVLVSRPYQSQLEEIATKQNTIIHLPTGSGKTFIAIGLIKRFKRDLKKPWGSGGKRTFFLVNTVPLVEQQRRVIAALCDVTVAGYSSEDRVDYWNKAKWDEELRDNEVLVLTTQILSDMLQHNYIDLKDTNLLIFDECHHAVEDHPMRLVMKRFNNCPSNYQPRVLGLTATLLNSNVALSKIEATIKELEKTFHATIATVNELGEVQEYSTNPSERIVSYSLPIATPASTEAVNLLQDILSIVSRTKLPPSCGNPEVTLQSGQRDISHDHNKITKAVGNMVTDMIRMIQEYGVFGGSFGVLAHIIMLERLKRTAKREECLLYKTVITHCVLVRHVLESAMKNDKGFSRIQKHSSEQILLLLDMLKEYNPEIINNPKVHLKINTARKPLSAIIFTKQRLTAKVLYNILKAVHESCPDDFGFLKHEFLVGFNLNPFKDTREQAFTVKLSQKALMRFSNRELNCMISTSVIEEGVDIPQCTLVVRFDLPVEYRSYVQSKGRARSTDSNYVMLVERRNYEAFMKRYQTFQQTEKHLQRLLIGKNEYREAPTNPELQSLYKENIPPYINPHTGKSLLATGAISLLNRYCSMLPHDTFTVLTPMWLLEYEKALSLITIVMPIVCPVKENTRGLAMTNIKDAKRSAALNVCKKLHQQGELDANTMLPISYGKVDYEKQDIKCCFPNWREDDIDAAETPKAGTKKRVRKHNVVYPSCLQGPTSFKDGHQKFYLHLIHLNTAFEKPTENRELVLYNFLQKKEGFGLLTLNALPDLCDFPMYLSVGEVNTSIEVNYTTVQLDSERFRLVKEFHLLIFDQVLEIAKKFVVFDDTNNCLFVVPVRYDGQFVVDWQLVETRNEVPPVTIPSDEERQNLKVTRKSHLHTIVTPWYRSNIMTDRYVVTDVMLHVSPSSPFPANYCSSYERYYLERYSLTLVGSKDQPLLEVRSITTKMNCLLPRAATLKTLTDKEKRMVSQVHEGTRTKLFNEVFIPEFCIKYTFPSLYWYKSTILPSIIHRVTMLLKADELRSRIAREANLGKVTLEPGQKWKPIELNVNIATKSLLAETDPPPDIQTIDRINNPIDESVPRPVNRMSMKESMYKLAMKKLDQQYPWSEDKEPMDIERNMSKATVMDIECYDEFVSAKLVTSPVRSSSRKSPPAPPPTLSAHLALPLPPAVYKDKIDMLSIVPSGLGPQLRDVLSAITTIGSNDLFHLERTETLGDSFLKFAATLYLFHKYPKLNEGQLTNIKGRLIGNRNLYYAGERIQLGGMMKSEKFSPRNDFVVPGFTVPALLKELIEEAQIRPTFLIGAEFSLQERLRGAMSEASYAAMRARRRDRLGPAEHEPVGGVQAALQCYVQKQAVSDKSVADCVEALVGTYLLSDGVAGAVAVLEWLRVLPTEDSLMDSLHRQPPTAITLGAATTQDIDYCLDYSREAIENILQYKFQDPAYLLEAMSHPSYIRNRVTRSYERLEFLGDAVLDMLITTHIYELGRDLRPGELTDLRSSLVNNVTFASFVVKLGLHKYICYQLNPSLDKAIMTFVEHQESRDHQIEEDVIYLIDEEDCHIAEYIEVPKVLSDIFEALVGAMYLDSGGDLTAVWRVVYRIMHPEIHSFSLNIPKQPVRLLHENIFACPLIGPSVAVDSDVPRVMVPVTITRSGAQCTVHGFGGNKYQARRAAAKLALKVLSV